jgi:hypothetical protein
MKFRIRQQMQYGLRGISLYGSFAAYFEFILYTYFEQKEQII